MIFDVASQMEGCLVMWAYLIPSRCATEPSPGPPKANLPLTAGVIRQALVTAWDAGEPCRDWPRERTARLVAEKYSRPEWNAGG